MKVSARRDRGDLTLSKSVVAGCWRPVFLRLIALASVLMAAGFLTIGAGPALAVSTDVLLAGQTLTAGHALWSSDHRYEAVMQGDGNFVVYASGSRAIWNSRTFGHPGSWVTMQSDGNLVVYAPGAHPLWWTGTQPSHNDALIMQTDGNLVIYSSGRAFWSTYGGLTGARGDTLMAGQALMHNQALWSADGRYEAVMQGDGNFVVYAPGSRAIWNTVTYGHSGAWLAMQGDGNLVVYAPGGQPLWWSSTQPSSGDALGMQTDGNLVIYSGGRALWSTYTGLIRQPASGGGQAIVNAAASMAGRPYCFGGGNEGGPTHGSGNTNGATQCGSGLMGFDCTGLTQFAAYRGTSGRIDLTHHDSQQAAYAPGQWITSEAALQPGDIVYFGYSRGNITHSAVYAGSGQIWDANTAFWIYPDGVRERSLASENSLNFVGAARVY